MGTFLLWISLVSLRRCSYFGHRVFNDGYTLYVEMRRRGRISLGRYRAPSERDIYREILLNWWLYRKMVYDWPGGDFLKESPLIDYYLLLGKKYLENISLVLYGIELLSFSLAVYLVNTGSLLEGILIGVLGILFTNHISETKISIDAILLASEQLENFDQLKKRERDLQVTR